MVRFQSFEDELGAANLSVEQGAPSVVVGRCHESQLDEAGADGANLRFRAEPARWVGHNAQKLRRSWRRQQQQPSWDSARTAEDEEDQQVLWQEPLPTCARWWMSSQGWVFAIVIGVVTFMTYAVIEVGVGVLASMRFGTCAAGALHSEEHCPDDGWIPYGEGVLGFFLYVGLGTGMAALSAWLVFNFAPTASGSGIPEVKTILNGFVLPDVLTFRTLCIKVPGLILAVASGMALGHEGPMVHVAVCWAQILSRFCPQFRSDARKQEILSASVAAGISSAFGTPIGSVLFSLEEMSSRFPSSTLLLAFVAAVSSIVVLSVVNLTGNRHLTFYSVSYKTECHPSEYVLFAILGVCGGLIGAVFNALNIRWNAFRMKPAFKKRVHPVLEVAVVALVTLLTSWPMRLTRPINAWTIHALFDTCSPGPDETRKDRLQTELGLCTPGGEYLQHPELLLSLGLAAVVRLLQMVLVIGTACPAGLFVPTLFIGACFGRCIGGMVKAMQASDHFFPYDIDPGVYSMVGAAAALGGVSRMTISLVVIMLELTGGPEYVVPFMLAVLLAKAVGDALNEGIYDLYIVLKGYPFLREEIECSFTERCGDIMVTSLTKLDVALKPRASDVDAMVKSTSFHGFPVVDGLNFIGYIRRKELQDVLCAVGKFHGEEAVIVREDIEPRTDSTVMRMVPEAPLTQAHRVFKQLGCRYIFIVGTNVGNAAQEALLGIVSKKSFLCFLRDRKVAHDFREASTANPSCATDIDDFLGSPHAPTGGFSVLDIALAASAQGEAARDDVARQEATAA